MPASHAGNLDMIVKTFLSVMTINILFAAAVSLPQYGGGSGHIHYFACNGAETNLLSCRKQTFCQNLERAGVTCFNGQLKSTFCS